MRYPETLPAFTQEQYVRAHVFLASRVAGMMGRKFEEGDWAYVYCSAKNIPDSGWSNVNIDIMHKNLGVEHKMLRVKSSKSIKEWCGTSRMHPAATRSIRIPSTEGDPTEIARQILAQYAELIQQRTQQVAQSAPGIEPDMRIGWLLWQDSLREFLYFEEEMLAPDPKDFLAEWRESGGGIRKASRNLWVYERETGRKRYSITTLAGAKIQPYFDVPPPKDPNLYYFCVQGEAVEDGLIRIWVTSTTAIILENLLGSTDIDTVSTAILKHAEGARVLKEKSDEYARGLELAKPIFVSRRAYRALSEVFSGVSDEHMMQLFVQYLSR